MRAGRRWGELMSLKKGIICVHFSHEKNVTFDFCLQISILVAIRTDSQWGAGMYVC